MNNPSNGDSSPGPQEKRQFWDKTGIQNLAAIAGILSLMVAVFALMYPKDIIVNHTPKDTVKHEDKPKDNPLLPKTGDEKKSPKQRGNTVLRPPVSAKMFNVGEQTTLGVIAANDSGYDAMLTNNVTKWLLAKGVKASNTVILENFVNEGHFQKVIKSDLSVLQSSEAKNAMQFMLLIKKGPVAIITTDTSKGNPLLREKSNEINDIQSECVVRLVNVKNTKMVGNWNKIFREKGNAQTTEEEVINSAIGNYVKSLKLAID